MTSCPSGLLLRLLASAQAKSYPPRMHLGRKPWTEHHG
jgi:hypothetical protein